MFFFILFFFNIYMHIFHFIFISDCLSISYLYLSQVLADGRVYLITSGGSSWLSLAGITFSTNRNHAFTLQGGWKNYGSGYRLTSLQKYGDVCFLSGLIRHGSWSQSFGRTHSHCVPRGGRLIFSTCNHAHVTRVDVTTAGVVLRGGGYANHHWVSLDGMVWNVNPGSNLPLYNGWRNYGYGYRPASSKRVIYIYLII